MKVIGLERGPRLTTTDFAPHDELRYFQRQDLRPNPKRQPVTWRPNAERARAPLVSTQLRQPGRRRHRALRRGVVALPRGRLPRALADDRALRRVRDPGGFLGHRLAAELRRARAATTTAPNTSSACRARPAICRARRSTAAMCSRRRASATIRCRRCTSTSPASSSKRRAKKLGYHPFSTPRAILSQPYNGRPGCTYCGFCQAFGCHVGAKSSILVTKLPEADATGNFKLITGAMCYRVNSDNSGRATGVSYYGPDRFRQHDRGRDRHPRALHLRQHAAAAAVEDREIPERPRQFERPPRQAHHGPYRRARVRGLRRPLRQHLHGTERAEAHDRRLQRRQLRPQGSGLHPRRADFGRARRPRRRPDRQPP